MYKEKNNLVSEKMENNEERKKEVTVGIVAYNSRDEITTLMDSLESCSYFNKISVYVVDNASQDNTIEIIKKKYPWAKIIENEKNLGFGKGHNKVIEYVYSKYHIIVNPDIRVENDTIEKCVEFMNQNKDVVVLTPLILNTDGTQQFLPKKNPSTKYMIGGLLENYSKKCRKLRDEYTLKNEIITSPVDVEFCSGCFMFTRTEDLQKIGGFDKQYFLHFEDADLTREFIKVGRAVYDPSIKVVHKWKRENKKMNKSLFFALKSMCLYMKKWK